MFHTKNAKQNAIWAAQALIKWLSDYWEFLVMWLSIGIPHDFCKFLFYLRSACIVLHMLIHEFVQDTMVLCVWVWTNSWLVRVSGSIYPLGLLPVALLI